MLVGFLALGICLCSLAYFGLAIFRVRQFAGELKRFRRTSFEPPVTLLKPIYRGDPQLLSNLRSCCQQDYAEFQIIFGFRFHDDPAIAVVRQVIEEFPEHDLHLVIDPTVVGPNLKVSSLSNMEPHAKHDFLVVADSDMRVQPDYLSRVMSPFVDADVGASTCLYRGASADNACSKLAALFVNDWFLPSALVSTALRELRYCFGATMAVRRHLLESMGGFAALADYLADDYMLGQRVSQLGSRVALAPCVVENFMEEASLSGLWRHELRWSRTMRAVEPFGFACALITDLILISLLSALVVYAAFGHIVPAIALVVAGLLGRLWLHHTVVQSFSASPSRSPWLIVLRDLMTASLRIWSYLPGPVVWRGYTYDVDREGKLMPRDDDQRP